MQRLPVMMCLMMMLVSLTGCIGEDNLETEEGDDVILEDTDDWPTYYVQTSGDLPTCDTSTLGRLYYVEDDVNFQACMSTGWEIVEIGGSNGNLVLNQAPSVESNFWGLDDDYVIDTTGDGEFDHIIFGLHWDAKDVDGTISQIGIDYDGDLVIDTILPADSGAYSQDEHTSPNGYTFSGFFSAPMYQGLTVHKTMTPSNCHIGVTRTISVIAIDDDGAMGISSQTISAYAPSTQSPIGSTYWYLMDAYDVRESEWMQDFIPATDYDWLMGVGGSTCPGVATFSLTAGSSFTSGTSDVLGTLSLDSGTATGISHEDCDANNFYFFVEHSDGSKQYYSCYSWRSNFDFSVTASASGSTTDTWVISEDGTDICSDTGANDCIKIGVRFSTVETGDDTTCIDSVVGLNENMCEF